MTRRQLAGLRVVTTRTDRGRLDTLLAAAGADVVHVPMIGIEPVDDPRLDAALDRLDDFDWLVVTSRHGAVRVGSAAAEHPTVRLAAVGAETAAEFARRAGRAVDVVPQRQTATDLARSLPAGSSSVLVAQADRADDVLATALAAAGHVVEVATAYRTVLRVPTWRERQAVASAAAVGFASGSAAEAWVGAFGATTPPVAAAIGPTTARAAARAGLGITHVAGDHDVDGLAAVITAALTASP